MKRKLVLGAIIAVGALTMAPWAFQGPPAGGRQGGPNVAQIEKVKDNLYMITGGGGNTAAFVTDSGVVIVDTKLANWGQAILDKVRTVSDKPVSLIINTHTHPDHTGSNEFFGPTVDVVAHENTKMYMQNMDAFKGAGARFLPKRTFKDTMKIGSGKDEIDLYYFGRAHTGGDAWVLFRTPRVVHAGDAFAGKNIPLVDTFCLCELVQNERAILRILSMPLSQNLRQCDACERRSEERPVQLGIPVGRSIPG